MKRKLKKTFAILHCLWMLMHCEHMHRIFLIKFSKLLKKLVYFSNQMFQKISMESRLKNILHVCVAGVAMSCFTLSHVFHERNSQRNLKSSCNDRNKSSFLSSGNRFQLFDPLPRLIPCTRVDNNVTRSQHSCRRQTLL